MSGATNDSVVSMNQQTEKRPLRAEVLYRAEVEASSDCFLNTALLTSYFLRWLS
jgi:hypothetical protein